MELTPDKKIQIDISELSALLGICEKTTKDLLNNNKQEVKNFVRFTDGRSKYRIARKPFEEWFIANYRRLVG